MKTAELIGPALDWAVAKSGGGGKNIRNFIAAYADFGMYHYSTDWSQGGPIIEREEIEITNIIHVFQGQHLRWRKAVLQPKFTFENYTSRMAPPFEAIGPTILVAAMRCFVASKPSDEVDIPEELK